MNSYTEECIKHCLSLDYPDYEVLVLPDEPSDSDLPNVRVIATGAVAPSRKRDISVDYASGEMLAFIDDDAYPIVSWLSQALAHFQHDDVAAVCGPAVTPPGDSYQSKASGFVFSSLLGGGSVRYRYIPQKKRAVDDYPSCNFIIRKRVFQEVGGISTHFWPGEDTKLCLEITHRLRQKIVYDPNVLVYHHRRSLFLPHSKQVWSYAVHRGYFAKKYPRTSLRISYFIPSLFCLGILFGVPLSILSPVFRVPFLSLIGIYVLLSLGSSVQSKDIRIIPLVFSGIIATHITYGIGFIKGLLARKLAR